MQNKLGLSCAKISIAEAEISLSSASAGASGCLAELGNYDA